MSDEKGMEPVETFAVEPVSVADYCYMRMTTRQPLDHAQFREAITYPAAQGLRGVGRPEGELNEIDDPAAVEYDVRIIAGNARHAGVLLFPNPRHAEAIAQSLATAVAHGYIEGRFRFRAADDEEREAIETGAERIDEARAEAPDADDDVLQAIVDAKAARDRGERPQ